MERFKLTGTFTAVALFACGCGSGSAPERSATRVLRPDEAKISLGEPSEPVATPAETESGAPAAPSADAKP